MAIEIDYNPAKEDAGDLRDLYNSYPAWAGRTVEEVRNILDYTDEVICLWDTETEDLIGSARVLTDYHYYGMIYEVIVLESRRSEGFGERVMNAISEHPRLEEVTLMLHCQEKLVPFYEKCGFTTHDRGLRLPSGETSNNRTMKQRLTSSN